MESLLVYVTSLCYTGDYKAGQRAQMTVRRIQNYLTVGAVIIPIKRILHQLNGWLAWNTKICFKKKVFNSVSWKKKKKKALVYLMLQTKSKAYIPLMVTLQLKIIGVFKAFSENSWVLSRVAVQTCWQPIQYGHQPMGSKGRGWMLGEAHRGTSCLSCFLVRMTVTWVTCVICWDSQDRHTLKIAGIMRTNTCHGTPVRPYRSQAHPGPDPGPQVALRSGCEGLVQVSPGAASPGQLPVWLTALQVPSSTEETSAGTYVLNAQSPRPAFPLRFSKRQRLGKVTASRTHCMDQQVQFSDVKHESFPTTLTSKI